MTSQPTIVLKEGRHYIVDRGFANEGRVQIVTLLGNGFAIIKDSDSKDDFEWVVKIERLSEIK